MKNLLTPTFCSLIFIQDGIWQHLNISTLDSYTETILLPKILGVYSIIILILSKSL